MSLFIYFKLRQRLYKNGRQKYIKSLILLIFEKIDLSKCEKGEID